MLSLLKTKADFEAFRQSKSYQTNSLRIRVIARLGQNAPRFGFIVPKKVLPKAVYRNLVKRRIKTFLTRHAKLMKPADVLIFPRSELLKVTYEALETELKNLFSKARLWK